MIKKYMDYGQLISENSITTYQPSIPINNDQYGQVYYHTHDGEGNSLSFMNKAFISFTYGNRKIEDFGLIAVTVNDRLDRQTPPQHEDYITNYKMLNGQYYWGTHYNAREMTITLATDGMTQQQLDDFKCWFKAGINRQLVLSQHPNRGIMARIKEAPQISMIPFKKQVEKIINKQIINTTIIEYKGNILLNFVMDKPFWYAIKDVFGQLIDDEFGYRHLINVGIDINNNIVDILTDDNYKTIIQDHIPTGEMINNNVLLGNGAQIIPYNEYKYTLTNQGIEVKDSNGNFISGTPVVNTIIENNSDQEIESGEYPLTGGIVGPLYIVPIEGEKNLTSLESVWYKTKTQLDLYGQIVSNLNDNSISTIYYIPAKKGSTIQPIMSKLYDSTIVIYLYDIIDRSLISTQSLSSTFICPQDCYIRFFVILSDKCESKNINEYFNFNISTFKSNGLGLASTEFSDKIDIIKEDWILIGYKLSTFDGKHLTILQNKSDDIIVKKLLPVKAGSTINIKENLNTSLENKLIMDVYFYNIQDKSFEYADISISNKKIIDHDSYIRLSFHMPNINLQKINNNVQFNLLTYSKNPISLNYFYSGTAPSYPTLEFSVPIHFNTQGYIDSFSNEYALNENGQSYDTLILEGQSEHKLKLTTPNIFTSYNKAIEILSDDKNLGLSIPSLIQLLRLSISHQIIRDWVINCINIYQRSYNGRVFINDSNKLMTLTYRMRYMIISYMPYVFDTFINTKITPLTPQPPQIISSQKLIVDYDYFLLKELNGDYSLNVDIGELNFTLGVSTTNANFYQWQESIDSINWYPIEDSDTWSGSTTSTLRCSVISSSDCDKFYRCRVSNYEMVIDTQPIKLQARDTELYFLQIPSDVIKNLYDNVNLSWSVKNCDYDRTTLFYKLSDSQNWVPWESSSINGSISQAKLVQSDVGTITFSFKIAKATIDGCMFRLKIENSQHPEGLMSGTQQKGVALTVISTQMNTRLTYQISNDGENWSVPPTNVNYIIKGTYIRVQAVGIKNTISQSFFATSRSEAGQPVENVNSPTSSFYKKHKPTIQTVTNNDEIKIYLIWQSDLGDENFSIFARVYGVNEQEVTSGTVIVQRIIEENDPTVPIKAISSYSIYSWNHPSLTNPNNLEGLIGDSIQITAIESNFLIEYEWYFQGLNESTWHKLPYNNIGTVTTTKTLVLSNIQQSWAGKYRVKLYRSNYTNIQPYDDEQIYVYLQVKPKIQITVQPQQREAVTYYDDDFYPFALSCTATNATRYIWYYKNIVNGISVPFNSNQSSIIEDLGNGTYTYGILINNFRYSQLKDLQFYCVLMNEYSEYSVKSDEVRQYATKTDTRPVSFTSSEAKTDFNWYWPIRAPSNSGYARTGIVRCYCKTVDGKDWEFYGMPPTLTLNALNDGMYQMWDNGNQRAGALYQSANDDGVSEKCIASIATTKASRGIRYTYLQLTTNIQQAQAVSGVFGMKLFCKYYNKNNTLLNSFEITNFNEPTVILSQETVNFNNIRKIEIHVRPYYTKKWTGSQAIAIENTPTVGTNIYSTTILADVFTNRCKTWMGILDGGTSNYKFNLHMQGKTDNWTNIPSDEQTDDDPYDEEQTNVNNIDDNLIISGDGDYLKEVIRQLMSRRTQNSGGITPKGEGRWRTIIAHERYNNIDKALSTNIINIKFTQELPIQFLSFVKYFADIAHEYTFIYKKKPNSNQLAWYFNDQYYDEIPGMVIERMYTFNSSTSEKIYRDITEGTVIKVYIMTDSTNIFSMRANFKFDNEIGQYKIKYKYNKILWPNAIIQDFMRANEICYLSSLRKEQSYIIEEDAGDMILYNNFIFSEQNHFQKTTGTLQKWNSQDKTLCHRVKYNGKNPLSCFSLYYKNYYL